MAVCYLHSISWNRACAWRCGYSRGGTARWACQCDSLRNIMKADERGAEGTGLESNQHGFAETDFVAGLQLIDLLRHDTTASKLDMQEKYEIRTEDESGGEHHSSHSQRADLRKVLKCG